MSTALLHDSAKPPEVKSVHTLTKKKEQKKLILLGITLSRFMVWDNFAIDLQIEKKSRNEDCSSSVTQNTISEYNFYGEIDDFLLNSLDLYRI